MSKKRSTKFPTASFQSVAKLYIITWIILFMGGCFATQDLRQAVFNATIYSVMLFVGLFAVGILVALELVPDPTSKAIAEVQSSLVAEKSKLLDDKIKNTICLVEANDFEQFTLWKNYHEMVPWEQMRQGYSVTVGWLDGRPIVLSLFWDKINHKLVCFYSSHSEVVDHALIGKYLTEKFPDTQRCDANNFHVCLEAVNQRSDKHVQSNDASVTTCK